MFDYVVLIIRSDIVWYGSPEVIEGCYGIKNLSQFMLFSSVLSQEALSLCSNGMAGVQVIIILC